MKAALKEASPVHMRYAIALFYASNPQEAAQWLAISPEMVYEPEFRRITGELHNLIKENFLSAAIGLLERHLLEAVMVKAGGLKSNSETIRQRSASEIMDRVLGKAGVKSGDSGGNTFNVLYVKDGLDPAGWEEEVRVLSERNESIVTPGDEGLQGE